MHSLTRPTLLPMDTTLSPPAGQLLDGRYLVEAQLARGGMATVYLATDTRLDRTVALKIAHPELAVDEEFVGRFIGEARSAARLSSPHVVAVYDQGSAGPLHYLVMEYVRGRTLRELLNQRGRLSPPEALEIIDGVLSGLAVAHESGIAHRDMKPENVLLTRTNVVKVADFGLARAAAAAGHTKYGMIIGTAAYLAPEQVSASTSDARSDVYAVGIMLFEMLTGRQPHTGDTPLAVAYQHVNDAVPAPSRLVPGLPGVLDALVAMATSRNPDLRPADAGQFLAAVTAVRRGTPIPAVLPGRPTAAAYDRPWQPAGSSAAGQAMTGLAALGFGPPGPGADGAPGETAQLRPGSGEMPAADVRGDSHRGANHTLIAATGESWPGYGDDRHSLADADRGYGRHYEPALQRWLFSRRLLAAGLVVVLVLVAWLGIGWVVNGQYRMVPRVAGMTARVGRTDLRNDGFAVRMGSGEHNSVPVGVVIRTRPAAGSRVRHGSTITIVSSLGPAFAQVPPVTGISLASAEAALRQAGLTWVTTAPATSTTIAAGTVISTSPVAGTRWPKDRPVAVTASAGPPLPNFAGEQLQAVQAAAQAGGYTINPVQDAQGTQPQGTVVRQSPAPGTAISPHEVVTVHVSPGPPPVQVPNVDGMRAARAVAVLQNAGFKVRVNEGLGSRVRGYSPSGPQPAGSTITINVGFTFP